jgi:hypothetical protein
MFTKAAVVTLVILGAFSNAIAAPTTYNLSGKITGASGYRVMLVRKNGVTKEVTLGSSGAFSFKKLSASELRGASLQLVDGDGRYAGPVVLARKGSKVSTTFSGKVANTSALTLGKVTLKEGYATLRKAPLASVYNRPNIFAEAGKPVGAGEMGLADTASISSVQIRAEGDQNPGADGDRDGIPSAFDADDDGDLVLDGSDPDAEGLDIPYTSLFFDFRRTLNAHVRDGLTAERVNNVVGGENSFALTFFFSLPEGSSIDGGHVICDDALTYCRKDSPLAYYGGVSESTEEFRDKPWSELLTSAGYPRMEKITLNGGGNAMVASIQPRVDATVFRPGDVYRVVLTDGSRTVSTKSLALTPYFVSIPALKEYNAGSGTVAVDYSSVTPDSGAIPGVSSGAPIVLSSEGILTATFWRPQRAALRSDESGFYDWGNLHYGIIVDEAQATCAGYYTSVSSELSVDSTPLGNGDSPLASQGANLTPYTDSIGDRAADAANTLTFAVNLKECLARAGRSAGIYSVTLQARGESFTGGSNAAAQTMYVQIP